MAPRKKINQTKTNKKNVIGTIKGSALQENMATGNSSEKHGNVTGSYKSMEMNMTVIGTVVLNEEAENSKKRPKRALKKNNETVASNENSTGKKNTGRKTKRKKKPVPAKTETAQLRDTLKRSNAESTGEEPETKKILTADDCNSKQTQVTSSMIEEELSRIFGQNSSEQKTVVVPESENINENKSNEIVKNNNQDHSKRNQASDRVDVIMISSDEEHMPFQEYKFNDIVKNNNQDRSKYNQTSDRDDVIIISSDEEHMPFHVPE